MSPADPLFPPRPTALAQDLLRPAIRPGDTVVDATAGNGHDTLFLAECVGENGKVLAFDVQEAAVISAKARVEAAGAGERVAFFNESHALLGNHAATNSVRVVMFNLGYLPGEDHSITTVREETIGALQVASEVLQGGGILSVICYPGHAEGGGEAAAVEEWFAGMTASGWRVARYGAIGTRKPAPYLLIGMKPSR